MDNIRQQIIQQLDKEPTFGNYKKLKYCFISEDIESIARVDMWFQGVVESLYYRPNKYVLVLEGKQGIGKTEFFRHLLPERELYKDCVFEYSDQLHSRRAYSKETTENIYTSMIIDLDFGKNMLNIPMEENFIVTEFDAYEASMTQMGYEIGGKIISSDKRLASYCSTTNKWQHPPRNNFIVLKLESINQELFNSIDKLQLWIEIFNKFKP